MDYSLLVCIEKRGPDQVNSAGARFSLNKVINQRLSEQPNRKT